jgi:hypothetical protein
MKLYLLSVHFVVLLLFDAIFIYIFVALCNICALLCVFIICCSLLFYIQYIALLLPVFQFQVLIWTGDSSSNPQRAYRDILLAVNDLTREHSRRCEGRKGIQSVGLDTTSINCQIFWSFTARVFLGWNLRLLSHGGHNSFSRGACERPPKTFIYSNLGVYWIELDSQWYVLFQNLSSANEVFIY